MDVQRPSNRSVVERLATLLEALTGTDLEPGPAVDPLFHDLVELALGWPGRAPVASDPAEVVRLFRRARRLGAQGEARLERYWAGRVIADPGALGDFPYLGHYRTLVTEELRAIRQVRRPDRVAFVGCGPLPLTAVLLQDHLPDVDLVCVERDAEAARTATAIADALGVSMRVVRAEAAEIDYTGCDVVLVAALVGDPSSVAPPAAEDPAAGKRRVLEGIVARMGPGAVLGVRSVPAGGRELLYPRVRCETLPAGVRVLGELPPPPGTINSLLLAQVGLGHEVS